MFAPILTALAFVSSPVGTALGIAWKLISSPVGRAIIYVALVVGAFGFGDVHGRLKEHAYMVTQNKQETARAVAEANAARDAADKKFTSGRFNNRPGLLPGRVRHGSDGFSRD